MADNNLNKKPKRRRPRKGSFKKKNNKPEHVGNKSESVENPTIAEEESKIHDIIDYVDASIAQSKAVPIKTEQLFPKIETNQNPDDEEYFMGNQHRGMALIYNQKYFNNPKYKPRDGTDADVSRIIESVTSLGFTYWVFEDLTKAEIFKSPKAIVDKDNNLEFLKNSDCIAIFVLTHGEKDDKLMAKDFDFNLYEFVDLFTPDKMPFLALKPKLFFIQACRGTKLDEGIPLNYHADMVDGTNDDENDTYPIFADLYIAMSSHHGHFSFRNENGSWFIQALCNSIDNANLEEDEIEDILRATKLEVSRKTSFADKAEFHGKKQISSTYSTLIRKLYFKPKN